MHFRYIISFGVLFYSHSSYSKCTKEDVDFYLEKGFTQEQITQLCSAASPEGDSVPEYQPYQQKVIIYSSEGAPGIKDGLTLEERRATNALRGGIDGRSIEVTTEDVNYIRPVCVKWKSSPNVQERIEKCIDVAFSLSRDNLKVNYSGVKLLLIGQQQLEVSSAAIKRKFVTSDPWKGLPPDKKHLIKRKYETLEKGNTTTIPLRKTADPGQMVNAIRTLADVTKAKQSGTTTSEVSRVLDDSYVPPTEEEYLASQRTYEETREEKKKKKKKWWNPFD